MKPVLVIGSSNTDMVVQVGELPGAGQTVLGNDFKSFAGGKGANQAVAARRAGAPVSFIAAVGDDELGQNAVALLGAEGIDIDCVQVIANTASGVALIFVSRSGENCIAVAPGANAMLAAQHVRDQKALFDAAAIVLLQLETSLESVAAAVEMARSTATPCVLNPAPAADIPADILRDLYCITPNETEAEALTGLQIRNVADAEKAARDLLSRGVRNAVITLGKDGALLCNAEGVYHQTAEAVDVVDTTGAGDTFNGVFAAMLAQGKQLPDAIRVAVTAASLSVQTAGAIASIPVLGDEPGQPLAE